MIIVVARNNYIRCKSALFINYFQFYSQRILCFAIKVKSRNLFWTLASLIKKVNDKYTGIENRSSQNMFWSYEFDRS